MKSISMYLFLFKICSHLSSRFYNQFIMFKEKTHYRRTDDIQGKCKVQDAGTYHYTCY